MSPALSLRLVKVVHTIVWAFFAGCILAIPAMCWLHRYTLAWALILVVLVEVFVLAFNRLRCPLTDVAAKYTADRQDNFDIYLPLWLARYNKLIFGVLYLLGTLMTFVGWSGWISW